MQQCKCCESLSCDELRVEEQQQWLRVSALVLKESPFLSGTSVHKPNLVFPLRLYYVCVCVCVCQQAEDEQVYLKAPEDLLSRYSWLAASSNFDQSLPPPFFPSVIYCR